MATTVLQIQIDEDLKNKAVDLFEKMGADIPTAIRIFLKRSVAEKAIPFEVRERPPTYSTNKGWNAFMELRN